LVAVTLDITARKDAEHERERLLAMERAARAEAEVAQEQIANIFNSITDGFFSIRYDWEITYVNRAGAELAQLAPEAIVGKGLWELFPDGLGTALKVSTHAP
jgi:PAS domain-containing protein